MQNHSRLRLKDSALRSLLSWVWDVGLKNCPKGPRTNQMRNLGFCIKGATTVGAVE